MMWSAKELVLSATLRRSISSLTQPPSNTACFKTLQHAVVNTTSYHLSLKSGAYSQPASTAPPRTFALKPLWECYAPPSLCPGNHTVSTFHSKDTSLLRHVTRWGLFDYRLGVAASNYPGDTWTRLMSHSMRRYYKPRVRDDSNASIPKRTKWGLIVCSASFRPPLAQQLGCHLHHNIGLIRNPNLR